jgi:hypothetical protein
MVPAEPVFQLLYVSRLAAEFDFGVVKDIVAVARRHNAERAITGALLFDGERFCQLLEGSQADVQALMQTIERDPRHTHLAVLLAGRPLAARSMPRWASGYCDAGALEPFDTGSGLHDQTALDAFQSILRGADLD